MRSLQLLRCCDGCFNRTFAEVELDSKAIFLAGFKPAIVATVAPFPSDQQNKSELFASASARSQVSSDHSAVRKATTASTANVLSEARQNLEERGQKLNQLSDKTDKLAAASSDFADMAKQLKKQQQKSSWWG